MKKRYLVRYINTLKETEGVAVVEASSLDEVHTLYPEPLYLITYIRNTYRRD